MRMVEYIGQLHWADVLIIVLYFLIIIAVGLWSSCKNRGRGISGYFLAGRSMTWFLVGGSLYGSNIGSEHFIGLSGSGAASGIAAAGFELHGMFTLVALGWLFLPVYTASGVYTMPEYLKKRYGGQRISLYLALITLLLSIIVKTSVDLFSGSIFVKVALNWNLYAAVSLQLCIAAISTLAGGLTAVMWTDTLQVMLLIVGAFIVMSLGFYEVGGYTSLIEKYMLAIPSSNVTIENARGCAGVPNIYAMRLLRPMDSDLPWSAITFGLIGNAVWYWCCDQVIVQKALAGKNFSHAKGGCLMTGFLKFLPLWMMIFPGMISRVLYTDEIACTNPVECSRICDNSRGCSNIAYPLLVIRLLPVGVRGILVAVMMAAIMSNITSTFNSTSTIFTMDIWKHFRKNAKEVELLIVGRVFVLVMIVSAILWIPIINSFPSSQLITYVQSVQSYIGPPICAIFILGIFVPRVNEQGAFWGLILGLIIGLIRFIMEIAYGAPFCNEKDTRPSILLKIHYLHFALLLLLLVSVIAIVISYLTEPISENKLMRLTFWTRYSTKSHPVDLTTSYSKTLANGSAIANGHQINSATKPSVKKPFIKSTHLKKMSKLCIVVYFTLAAMSVPLDDRLRSTLYFVCGMEEQHATSEPEVHLTSLNEETFWRRFCNLAALILMTCGVFVYTFWA